MRRLLALLVAAGVATSLAAAVAREQSDRAAGGASLPAADAVLPTRPAALGRAFTTTTRALRRAHRQADTYYAWQVFVRTSSGTRRLPGPGRELLLATVAAGLGVPQLRSRSRASGSTGSPSGPRASAKARISA